MVAVAPSELVVGTEEGWGGVDASVGQAGGGGVVTSGVGELNVMLGGATSFNAIGSNKINDKTVTYCYAVYMQWRCPCLYK